MPTSRWSIGGGHQGWVAPSYQQIQQDRNRRARLEAEGASIARINHDQRQLQKVRQVERQASRAALRAEVAERNHALLAPRAGPRLFRSHSMGSLRYGLSSDITGGASLRKQESLVRERELLDRERLEIERERNRLHERQALAAINAQRRAIQADTARVRTLSAARRLPAAPVVAIAPGPQKMFPAVQPSPTSLVPMRAAIPHVGVPGLRRTASFNSGLIRPGMRNQFVPPLQLAPPVLPVQQQPRLVQRRPRVSSMSGLSPRLRPVQMAAPAPMVNYNTYSIQPNRHDHLGLPAQVSHLNLSPRAVPLDSFAHGGGAPVQGVRHASFSSYGGSPHSFGTPQQFHSAQNSPELVTYGGDFEPGYLGPPTGGLMMPGTAGAAYAQPMMQPAPIQQEFVFTDEPSFPGRTVVQRLGEVQGFSNMAAAAARGEDPLDAAIKSLVANAQMMGANGVLSMDPSGDEVGNVIVRGIAVVLA